MGESNTKETQGDGEDREEGEKRTKKWTRERGEGDKKEGERGEGGKPSGNMSCCT